MVSWFDRAERRCTCIPAGTDRDYWQGSLCEACEERMERHHDEAEPNDLDEWEDLAARCGFLGEAR